MVDRVVEERRGPALTGDGKPALGRQMHAYFVFTETWQLKESGDDR